jgi:hypothetical protein
LRFAEQAANFREFVWTKHAVQHGHDIARGVAWTQNAAAIGRCESPVFFAEGGDTFPQLGNDSSL